MKIIRYFFYKIYSFSLSNGETDPGWAMTIVAMFTLANVYSFIDIILILTQTKEPQLGKPIIIAFCGAILYLNYIMLMKNGKSKEIIKEFNDMTVSRAILNLYLALYIIGSIGLSIFTATLVRGN